MKMVESQPEGWSQGRCFRSAASLDVRLTWMLYGTLFCDHLGFAQNRGSQTPKPYPSVPDRIRQGLPIIQETPERTEHNDCTILELPCPCLRQGHERAKRRGGGGQ